MTLYCLTFTDSEMCYEGFSKDYILGMFESTAIAENVAGYYLENVPGFKDYSCEYRIDAKELLGEGIDPDPTDVWYITGFNRNDKNDRTDIVNSQLYHTKEQAEAELEIMKSEQERDEWTIDRYIIGQIGWAEGFTR